MFHWKLDHTGKNSFSHEHSLLHPQHRVSSRNFHSQSQSPPNSPPHYKYVHTYTPSAIPSFAEPLNNTVYNTQAPIQTYTNQTLYGKLEDHDSKRFYTQDPAAGASKFPLHKTIKNPLPSFWRRLKFILTPVSKEHQNRQPWNVPIERFINRRYNAFMVWWDTRTPRQRALPVILPLIPPLCAYLYWRSEHNLPRLVPNAPDYEYHPILPDKHIPYRSALLPHTLPGHLNGIDSEFIKEYVDYDPKQIVRPETVTLWQGAKYSLGRSAVGTYKSSVEGWGRPKELGGTDLRKPLVHDVPKPAESHDLWPHESQAFQIEDIRESAKSLKPVTMPRQPKGGTTLPPEPKGTRMGSTDLLSD